MSPRTLRILRRRAAHLAAENRRLKEEVAKLSELDPPSTWQKIAAKQLLITLGVLPRPPRCAKNRGPDNPYPRGYHEPYPRRWWCGLAPGHDGPCGEWFTEDPPR